MVGHAEAQSHPNGHPQAEELLTPPRLPAAREIAHGVARGDLPGQAPGHDQKSQRSDERRDFEHRGDEPVEQPGGNAHTRSGQQAEHDAVVAHHGFGRHHPDQGHDRPLGQIQLGRDDDQSHSEGRAGQERGLQQDVLEVSGGQEHVGFDGHHRAQDDDHEEREPGLHHPGNGDPDLVPTDGDCGLGHGATRCFGRLRWASIPSTTRLTNASR